MTITYRAETRSQSPPSNNYADLAAHRGDGGRFREAKDIETRRRREEEIDEDGGNAEEGWNGNGRGLGTQGGSHSRGEASRVATPQ